MGSTNTFSLFISLFIYYLAGGRYEITHTDKYLNLRINDARRGDRGEYQAHAVNSLGEDMASFLVTVTGIDLVLT